MEIAIVLVVEAKDIPHGSLFFVLNDHLDENTIRNMGAAFAQNYHNHIITSKRCWRYATAILVNFGTVPLPWMKKKFTIIQQQSKQ